MVTLSRLFIHPVKSMRGMGLTTPLLISAAWPSIACLWSPKPTGPLLQLASFRKW